MVLVDSSIWIEAARRQGDLMAKLGLRALLNEQEALLCSPVLLEVLGGARREERAALQADLACLPYVRVTETDYLAAVHHLWRLRDAGVVVPNNDVLIATLALRLQCRVYARDRHFEVMSRLLGFALYEPGYGGSYRRDGA